MVDPTRPPLGAIPPSRSTGPIITPALFADPNTRIIDESLIAHAGTPSRRKAIEVPNLSRPEASRKTILPVCSFVLSVAVRGGHDIAAYHILSHRAASGKEDEDMADLLVEEWYRLCCLGRMRFGLEGVLPGHLEAVRVVLEGFEGWAEGGDDGLGI